MNFLFVLECVFNVTFVHIFVLILSLKLLSRTYSCILYVQLIMCMIHMYTF